MNSFTTSPRDVDQSFSLLTNQDQWTSRQFRTNPQPKKSGPKGLLSHFWPSLGYKNVTSPSFTSPRAIRSKLSSSSKAKLLPKKLSRSRNSFMTAGPPLNPGWKRRSNSSINPPSTKQTSSALPMGSRQFHHP